MKITTETQKKPSVHREEIKPNNHFKLWAAFGGPIGLWSTLTRGGAELSWVLAGKFALMGANAAVMLFLAKRLDLRIYGLLVITISGQLLVSRLLMLGVDAGMIRLTALEELRSRGQEVITGGLFVMVCTSAVLIILALLAMTWLSVIPAWVVACIVIGSIGTAFVDYGYSFRLARQQYPLAMLAQGGTALLRLVITVVVAVSVAVHPDVIFLGYHGTTLLSGLLQALVIAAASWRQPDTPLIKRLLRYSFWQGKANVIVIFSLYQGTFLLMLLKDPAATGLFGLALTVSLGFFAIYNAYFEYLMARMRSIEVDAFPRFLTHSLLAALLLMVVCVPVIFALVKLLPWFLGAAWQGVVAVFVYLGAAMVLLVFQAPLEAACHYLLKPQLISFGWLARVVLIAIFGFILAPRMGATGAALAQLLGFSLGLLLLSYFVFKAIHKLHRSFA